MYIIYKLSAKGFGIGGTGTKDINFNYYYFNPISTSEAKT